MFFLVGETLDFPSPRQFRPGRSPPGANLGFARAGVCLSLAYGCQTLTVNHVLKLIKATFDDWMKDNALRLSAALTYYSIFSFALRLVIAIAVAGLVAGEEAVRGKFRAASTRPSRRRSVEVFSSERRCQGADDDNFVLA